MAVDKFSLIWSHWSTRLQFGRTEDNSNSPDLLNHLSTESHLFWSSLPSEGQRDSKTRQLCFRFQSESSSQSRFELILCGNSAGCRVCLFVVVRSDFGAEFAFRRLHESRSVVTAVMAPLPVVYCAFQLLARRTKCIHTQLMVQNGQVVVVAGNNVEKCMSRFVKRVQVYDLLLILHRWTANGIRWSVYAWCFIEKIIGGNSRMSVAERRCICLCLERPFSSHEWGRHRYLEFFIATTRCPRIHGWTTRTIDGDGLMEKNVR